MQLLFPSFLTGLVAIAIPIIIHLLQLRRPQRVGFTNTEFIKQLELTVARQRRLKQWLVLVARILALVFLVLAFCQPFIPASKAGFLSQGNGVQVVVDSSPSMQVNGESGGTLFRTAVSQAQSLGKVFNMPAGFILLNAGNKVLTSAAYHDKLQNLAISGHSVGQLESAVMKSASVVGTANPLYIFSDFQKKAVSARFIYALGTTRETVLVPEVGTSVANVFVDSVWFDDAFVRVRTNVGLHIRLRNGGRLDAKDCPVKVLLGPQQVAAFRVSVGAGQSAISVVQVQVADKDMALGRVELEDRPVAFDNTYYFTLRPAAQIRVVEVGATPVSQRLYSNEPVFSYTFSAAGSVDYGALRAASLVLMHEVPQVSAGLREALLGVVKRGGSVVVVPTADEKSHLSYQQLFRELGIGTAQWEPATIAGPELREVAMPSTRSVFFQDVFGAQQRQATMPRAAPVLHWARTDEDILKFRDGESFLATFRVGAGRVYVFAAPFATAYSDFTTHALFVPVLYRLAMRSYHNDQLPAYRLTQPALTLTLPEAGSSTENSDGASYRLVKDSLTLLPGQRSLGQELRLEVPADLREPGFYQLQRRGRVITTLAFNQDKEESELATYSAAELRQLLGKSHSNVRVLDGGVDSAIARYHAEQTGQPLWRYCLALALACLLAEVLLLRWGRRATAVPSVAV